MRISGAATALTPNGGELEALPVVARPRGDPGKILPSPEKELYVLLFE